MAVTYPPIYTEVLDAELNVQAPVTDEVVRKLAQNCNMLSKLAPIGQIISVAVNTPNNPAPNPGIYQYCDGTEITDVTSPLASSAGFHRFTPNLQGYFWTPAADQVSNNTFGTDTVNMSHAHGGSTGSVAFLIECNDGSADLGTFPPVHSHPIVADLSPSFKVNPLHVKAAFYIKIN